MNVGRLTASIRCTLSHYGDRQGREIDLIAETRNGHVAAIEIKSTTSPKHLHNLRWLRNKLDETMNNPGFGRWPWSDASRAGSVCKVRDARRLGTRRE